MRLLTLLFVLAVSVSAVRADDKADRERKVRVALALSAAGESVTPGESCGKCREDVTEARADGLRDGKPVVLFVGGPCDGLGAVADKAGGIPVRVAAYKGDDRPEGERRIVVLEPKADKSGLVIAATLPAKASAEKVVEEVKKAIPAKAVPSPAPTVQPLNWQF